jgi:3',5'-cyclic AMP phosphodiesterase CpdA
MTLRLIIDSDLHFKDGQIRKSKTDHVETILSIVPEYEVDAIICAGDLTDSGYDGKHLCCWHYGGKDDQVSPLVKFVNAIEHTAPVYLCMGNHDNYVPWPYVHKGVRKLIIDRHGSLRYSWDLEKIGSDGNQVMYHFICLDVYPNSKSIKFLKKDLAKNSDKIIIIYFHYCLTGGFSDWWTDNEKNTFYDTIKDYNIRLIIVGHRHQNWLDKWNGIDVVSGAGAKVVLCTLDGENTSIKQF